MYDCSLPTDNVAASIISVSEIVEQSNTIVSRSSNINVWVPASVSLAWRNQELMKDVGLVPYMLHKVFGYTATMLGCKEGEYPYLELLPGLEMKFLPDCTNVMEHLSLNIAFLKKHYSEMDVLILYGAYHRYYQSYLDVYHNLRPDGKVYLALDANSLWTDSISWTESSFSSFLDHCDVIGTSNRKMWQHLNKKWNRWTINYLPNGFYNPTARAISVKYEEKENILLTVGRIGIKEKANHILLEAFAIVHDELPDWQVHLVGAIEGGFIQYIEDYFSKYPELRNKVFFKGLIEDKTELFKQYAQAKVFIMTSISEGMPNVFSESLFHGCFQITSNIDAAEDVTDNGKLGRVFPINDISALVNVLREVCLDDKLLRETFPRILTYAKNNYDWELIIKRLHHMLFQQ